MCFLIVAGCASCCVGGAGVEGGKAHEVLVNVHDDCYMSELFNDCGMECLCIHHMPLRYLVC